MRGYNKEQRLQLTNRELDTSNCAGSSGGWMRGAAHDDALVFRDPGLSAYKPEVTAPAGD